MVSVSKEASSTAVLKSQQTAIEDAEYIYVFTPLRREMISHRKVKTFILITQYFLQ